MSEPAKARKTPCASCPYRKNVASGVWHEEEYAKLEKYDGEIGEQIEKGALQLFGCHQSDGSICAGWLGHRDPDELIAVRLGVSDGRLDVSAVDYTTTVPLFSSGAEAAEHGRRDMRHPSKKARETAAKIIKKTSINPER